MELDQRVRDQEQRIDQWRREFEATQDNPRRLRELRENITRAYERIVRLHLEASLQRAKDEAHLKSGAGTKKKQAAQLEARVAQLEDLLRKLGQEKSYQKPFLWPVAFPDAMNYPYEGFDIVLANPPYVRQEKLDAEDQKSYEQAFKDVFSGTADILVFFYARALQILRPGGWLAFITSNKYMRAAYGEGLRSHLSQKLQLHRITDFGDLPLFDANGKPVAAYPAVLIGRKNGKEDGDRVMVADLTYPLRSALAAADRTVNPENVRWALEDLGTILTENEIRSFPQVLLNRAGWILDDPALVRLFNRLMEQGTPLGKFVKGRMYRGILTGLNEAFAVNQAKRDELIAEDPRSAELIKRWVRGRDIKRWCAEWAGLYIIAIQCSGDSDATHPWKGAKSEKEAREIFRRAYPAVHDHLSWWEPKLRKRQDQGRFWWELRACAYYSEFELPKVLWGNLAVTSKFAWDESKAAISAPANILSSPPEWLLAVMNSSLLNFIYPKLTVSRGGGFQEFKIGYISPTPITAPPPDVQSEIIRLQKRLVTGQVQNPTEIKGIESEIDDLVYDAYQMQTAEKGLLREWSQSRQLQQTHLVETDEQEEDSDGG